jgi:hypothetical protein
VPQLYERLGDGLDEQSRAADVDARPLGRAWADLGEHVGVDPARVAGAG